MKLAVVRILLSLVLAAFSIAIEAMHLETTMVGEVSFAEKMILTSALTSSIEEDHLKTKSNTQDNDDVTTNSIELVSNEVDDTKPLRRRKNTANDENESNHLILVSEETIVASTNDQLNQVTDSSNAQLIRGIRGTKEASVTPIDVTDDHRLLPETSTDKAALPLAGFLDDPDDRRKTNFVFIPTYHEFSMPQTVPPGYDPLM